MTREPTKASDASATVSQLDGRPDPFPGEYRVVRELGRGYFGEVWLAEDLSPLTRFVALKFLRLGGSPERRAQALDVMRNEARVLGSVRHPNIVQVHAWREAGRPPFPCLVLQYVSGGSLDDKVTRGGPLPWSVAARYVADVADGLLLLHAKGVVHRDVKPANILFDPETGEALLTDFGIAAHLADLGTAAGTPRFMAPEAHRGELSPALDVFGLSATLFWLVTGQPPFDGETPPALAAAIERGLPAIDLRLARVPGELERLIRAGLAARAAERPDLPAFVRDLRGSLNLLLADGLATSESGGVNLRVLVSRQVDDRTSVPVASAQPGEPMPDRKGVPAAPPRVCLRSGDRVRLEVVADQPGFLTVFNVGPTGNLHLLHPADRDTPRSRQPANEILHVLGVELTPPAGPERLVALWTSQPFPLRLDELRGLVERPGPYRATRDMARVARSLENFAPFERQAVVLELDHR
jgi:serine/threonine protein kinase